MYQIVIVWMFVFLLVGSGCSTESIEPVTESSDDVSSGIEEMSFEHLSSEKDLSSESSVIQEKQSSGSSQQFYESSLSQLSSSGGSSVDRSSSEWLSSNETESSSDEVLTGGVSGKYFFYPEPDIVTVVLPQAGSINFNSVLSGYTFPTDFSSETITALNQWSNDLITRNPFAGLGREQVPWISIYATKAVDDQSYLFISQEQLAYLFLITIFGGEVTHPTMGEITTGLKYSVNYHHDVNYWMFSVMSFLTTIMKDERYKTHYVGAAMGNMNQSEGFDAILADGMDGVSMSDLNACYFDESKMMVTADKRPLKPEWCRGETSKSHPVYGIILDDEGGSFQAMDIPGQTTVDIGGLHYGGGTECAGCHVANTQDECLAVFYPETIGFSFFMNEGPTNPGLIHITESMTFFGVRKYLHGLNGSNRFNAGLCAYPQKPAEQMMEDSITIAFGDHNVTLYDHSMTFLASLNNIHGPDKTWWSAERKACGVPGGHCAQNEYDFCAIADAVCPGGSQNYTPPVIDIGKWYGAFTPKAYHANIEGVVKKMIRRIGTFNWGAGVWWGDAEAYFLYIWLATSMLEDVTLDYYIFASSCENSGVQCGMLSGDDCNSCYDKTAWPGNPFGQSCSQRGIGGLYNNVSDRSVKEVYDDMLHRVGVPGHFFDQY
ncbi:MAG: hypothetical protein OCD01_01620 [Fibrobacterales bacterium]